MEVGWLVAKMASTIQFLFLTCQNAATRGFSIDTFNFNLHIQMLFVVHAYDFQDEQALERRMAVRPNHLEGVRQLKANHNYVLGGALLSPQDKMIGSMMVVDFETESAMQQWLQNDPYVTGKVWEKIDVKPFRQAVVDR
jgi:uncharacterized protein